VAWSMTAGHLAGELQLLGQCAFPVTSGKEQPLRWRTQNPVESLHALVETGPAPDADTVRRSPAPDGWGNPPRSNDLLFGRYRLLECLGSGGFGVVWRARDELLHREVAVKRVSLAPNGERERAGREALAAARLAHPAIVALYEACAVEDALYLISELVHGKTLAQLIAARALGDEEVLRIGVALADALAHAHSRGVIHRDVKPQNVLVPRPSDHLAEELDESVGMAKLTDFGGARLAGDELATRTGDVLGTLAYMAPEQSEGDEVREEADLYSLALVLYEALSGVNPVRGSSPAATARRIGRPIASLAAVREDLPGALTQALDTGLSPSPSGRGTLEELRAALKQAAEQLAVFQRRRRPRRVGSEPADLTIAARPAALQPAPIGEPLLLPAVRAPAVPEDRSAPIADEEVDAWRTPTRALPFSQRLWLGCALATIVWLAATGRPGVALLALAAAAPLVPAAINRERTRRGSPPATAPARAKYAGAEWLLPLLAPVLGLVGLAGAYPAVAGQAKSWCKRAALGALGYWWTALAEPLVDSHSAASRLWLGEVPGTPPRAVWEGSPSSTAVHVIGPTLSLAVLLGAGLWATGAMVLPWVVRGRSAAVDLVAAVAWSAAVTATTAALASSLSTYGHPSPHGAILGALAGATFAVGARALRGPV
jgi:eukaryotic-like serine/threonine-protein kinase